MRVDPKFFAGYGLDVMSMNKLLNSSIEDLVVEIYAKTRPMMIDTNKKDPVAEMMESVYEKRISKLEDDIERLNNEISLLRDFINQRSKK